MMKYSEWLNESKCDDKKCGECRTCEARDTETYLDALHKYAKDNGIKNTDWSMDPHKLPIRGFHQKHGFKATSVKRTCYCVAKMKPQIQKIEGDTMLDVWKAFDKLFGKMICGHSFIEDMNEKDGLLQIYCGS